MQSGAASALNSNNNNIINKKGMLASFVEIFQTEGLKGLYRVDSLF
jgi:hypothetical protein